MEMLQIYTRDLELTERLRDYVEGESLEVRTLPAGSREYARRPLRKQRP